MIQATRLRPFPFLQTLNTSFVTYMTPQIESSAEFIVRMLGDDHSRWEQTATTPSSTYEVDLLTPTPVG